MNCWGNTIAKRKTEETDDVILPDPNSCAWEIHDIFEKYAKPSHIPTGKIKASLGRSIFTRSPVFEYHNINKLKEKVMNAGKMKCCSEEDSVRSQKLDTSYQYSPGNRIKLDCPPSYRSATLNPYTYAPIEPWQPKPQFWYDVGSAFKGPTWPVGNPNDYSFQPLPFPPPPPGELKEAIEIERPERYIPGEIYKNKVPKDPVQEFQGTGECITVWEPKIPEVFYSKFDDSTLPKQALLADAVRDKQTELRKRIIKENEPQCIHGVNKTDKHVYKKEQIVPKENAKVSFTADHEIYKNDRMHVKETDIRPAQLIDERKERADDSTNRGIQKTNDMKYKNPNIVKKEKDCSRKCCQ